MLLKNSAMSMQIILCQALMNGWEHRTIAYNDKTLLLYKW